MRWLVIGGCLLAGGILLALWPREQDGSSGAKKDPVDLISSSVHRKAFPTRKRPLLSRIEVQPPSTSFAETGDALNRQSLEIRVKIAAEFHAKLAQELWDLWLEQLSAKTDALKLDFIADALSTRLRDPQTNPSATVTRAQEFFLNNSHDEYAQWQVAQVLGQAATSGTMAALLSLLASTERPGTRALLLDQVAKGSQNNWSGSYHEDFTDLLTAAWEGAAPQSDVIPYIGIALASVGSPKALDLLFSQIQNGGRTITEFEERADDKAWLAFASLKDVRNPAALPILKAQLAVGSADTITTSAAGYCLARMGDPRATGILLEYAEANPTDLSAYIPSWFSPMRDEASAKLVDTAVRNAFFANLQNRDVVSNVFSVWLRERSQNLRPIIRSEPSG